MAKIKWNEDGDFKRIKKDGQDDERAKALSENKQVAALISGQDDYRFEEPIWMHSWTAYELHEAGIIEMHPCQTTHFDGLTVYVYTTA